VNGAPMLYSVAVLTPLNKNSDDWSPKGKSGVPLLLSCQSHVFMLFALVCGLKPVNILLALV